MAQRKSTAVGLDWKALVSEDRDVMRVLVQEVVQQVLESEMEEALQAAVESRVVPWSPFRLFPWRIEAEREQSRIRPVVVESGTVFDLGAEFEQCFSQFFWPRSWRSSVSSRRGRF